jgi:RNA polymerase sigma-70 factor (ECF subfamily)
VSGYDRPGAWVRRVLINLALDANRRRGNERHAAERLAHDEVLLPGDESSDEWWRAVRALPDRQRAAVALYYLEDMSVAGVARVLDVAEGTVKATLARARNTLANTLREGEPS